MKRKSPSQWACQHQNEWHIDTRGKFRCSRCGFDLSKLTKGN